MKQFMLSLSLIFLLFSVAHSQVTYSLDEYNVQVQPASDASTGERALKVTDVYPDTQWERVGLYPGDFIIAVNGRKSRDANEFHVMLKQAMNRAKAYGTRFCVTVDRNDEIMEICLPATAQQAQPPPPPPMSPPSPEEPQIPEVPRPPYQIGMCSLVISNQSHISWDVEINGGKIGTLNAWSQMETPCPCDSVMLKLYGTGFNFSRSLSKAFYPNERSGNKFIYRIRLGN